MLGPKESAVMIENSMWRRFVAKTIPNQETGCWIWHGAVDDRGYGRFKADKVMIAHRFSFQHANNVVLSRTQVVMHTCDNARCVNPSHLVVGTQSQNAIERWQRTGQSLSVSKKLETLIRRELPNVTDAQLLEAFSILGVK